MRVDRQLSNRNSGGALPCAPAARPLPPTQAADAPCIAYARTGLRALSRAQLDAFLTTAQCCVVSETHTPAFDAYVLSESSLFVYSTKLMIKTCGTTALLAALPHVLALAASVGAAPRRCRYSRACFMFPKVQPAPHRSWEEECAFLDANFPAPQPGAARVLGTAGKGLLWHVYVADAAAPIARSGRAALSAVCEPNTGAPRDGPTAATASLTLTLEVCMTQLDRSHAGAFIFGDAPAPPAPLVSAATGIRDMFPDAILDDFVFAPCGYSMNGLQGPGLATIHVTPEARCSYASVEISGHAPEVFCPADLLRKAVTTFGPGKISVAITCDVPVTQAKSVAVPLAWAKVPLPDRYVLESSSRVDLPGGGWVLHATLASAGKVTAVDVRAV